MELDDELFVVLLLLLLDFFCLLLEDVDEVVREVVASGSRGGRDGCCDASASFSGDDGESEEFVSWVMGL